MGNHSNISDTKFPKQGLKKGSTVKVTFHYGPLEHDAVVLRDDMESPWLTIFQLKEDGRVVLSRECQYKYDEGGQSFDQESESA